MRQDSFAALLKANSMPKTVLEPEAASRGTMAGLTTSGAPLSRVRDRLTIAETLEIAAPKPTPQDANAAAWSRYNEEYRAKYGSYPPN
jgi:hypothetical protein